MVDYGKILQGKSQKKILQQIPVQQVPSYNQAEGEVVEVKALEKNKLAVVVILDAKKGNFIRTGKVGVIQ